MNPNVGIVNISFFEEWLGYNEDTQGNFFHFALILFAGGSLFFGEKNALFFKRIVYFCVCGSAFLLFCYLLRWQEWHSRLHCPLFMLLMPFCAVALDMKKIRIFAFLMPLIIISILCTLLNFRKPVLPIQRGLSTQNRKTLYTSENATYERIAAYIANQKHHNVGLKIRADDVDYLFWEFLKANLSLQPVRIKHVNVTNTSAKALIKNDFTPSCVISTTDSSTVLMADGYKYYKSKRIGFCCIYQK